MLCKFSERTKVWFHSFTLAALGCVVAIPTGISSAANAADSLVSHDASFVSLSDQSSMSETDSAIGQVGFLSGSNGCGADACDTSCDTFTDGGCDSCGEKVCCCCEPWWAHRTGGFGQFLLLRAGNVDHIYSIEQNDTTANAFPTGPIGRVNLDEGSGFRVGASWAASDCTSLVASFTRFESDTADTIVRNGANVLNSQIIHPSTATTGASSLQSYAEYSLDFQLVDVAYRHIWKTSDIYAINWLAGFRYGNMEQNLLAQQQVSVATGLVDVDVNMDFNGFGSMFGIDAERRSPSTGMLIYAKGLSSFLAGDWKGTYRQTNQFGGGVVANEYEDFRVTPVLELELGLGWQSRCGKWRMTAGYLNSAWYDAISTRQYVDAVRATDYTSVGDTITFSGLTAQFERRF
ncbi:Lpg1974 family pore-forming outer membrane protein [Stieleria varia]|uniref:Legionella pneumophila major outer membrane protein n=1 Tax=Stieleria varia TaxID=2528005 RepID=A0A5C6AJQ4_9BACT|nr:Lpg1974 family pore-forming outer membrane protein [Stieleria varia]TWT98433.1 hypothetical protein Pla52n_49470 [Stieleria varia]